MLTVEESVCCKEVEQLQGKMQENESYSCITQHPGFEPVCLNTYVLETAYHQYKQQYKALQKPVHEKYRYIAYRQFVRWCWEFLGKNIRVPLPSCVVKTIRQKFNSPDFVGFKYPDI